MINKGKHTICFKLIILMMAMTMSITISAQNLCTDKLSKAEILFENGHLYEISGLLEECFSNGFSKEEKIRAYRLLTITYLYLDEHPKADQSYLALLRLNPEYKPNQAIDPAELFYLHDIFMTTPRWSIILSRVGLNLSFIQTYNSYTTDGFRQNLFLSDEVNSPSPKKVYIPGAGLTIGSGVKYGYSDKLSLTSEILLKYNRFKLKEELLGHSTLLFNEEQFNIELPLCINYQFSKYRLRPYFFGGASLNFLLHSSAKNLKIEREQGATVLPETGPNISLLKNRNSMGYSSIIGGGIQYKVSVNYILLEIRYTHGMKNIASRENRYANEEMLYRYMYVDDDMRMNNLMINVSYVRPFYNPRKKIHR